MSAEDIAREKELAKGLNDDEVMMQFALAESKKNMPF